MMRKYPFSPQYGFHELATYAQYSDVHPTKHAREETNEGEQTQPHAGNTSDTLRYSDMLLVGRGKGEC
jgi:hypothetical protein